MLGFMSGLTPSPNPSDRKSPNLRSATIRLKQEALRRYREAHGGDDSPEADPSSGTHPLCHSTYLFLIYVSVGHGSASQL